MAGVVTAVFAIIGAFWFGLLSFAAAIAYEPAGVRPRQIGLSSGTVLTQSAVGLAASIGLVALVAFVYVILLVSVMGRRRWLEFILIYLGLGVLVFGTYRVVQDARESRDALKEGRRTTETSFFFTLGAARPWSGEIAKFDWAQKKPAGAPVLPRCALYLGEASGTAVIYSATDKRTLRLPSSALIVTAMPERDSCS